MLCNQVKAQIFIFNEGLAVRTSRQLAAFAPEQSIDPHTHPVHPAVPVSSLMINNNLRVQLISGRMWWRALIS